MKVTAQELREQRKRQMVNNMKTSVCPVSEIIQNKYICNAGAAETLRVMKVWTENIFIECGPYATWSWIFEKILLLRSDVQSDLMCLQA